MNERVLSMLGLCRRAGKLALGFDAVCESVSNKKSALIVTASDISEGTLSKLRKSAGDGAQIVGMPFAMDAVGAAIGKNVRIISIEDEGFASKIRQLLESGNGEE